MAGTIGRFCAIDSAFTRTRTLTQTDAMKVKLKSRMNTERGNDHPAISRITIAAAIDATRLTLKIRVTSLMEVYCHQPRSRRL